MTSHISMKMITLITTTSCDTTLGLYTYLYKMPNIVKRKFPIKIKHRATEFYSDFIRLQLGIIDFLEKLTHCFFRTEKSVCL